MQPKPDLCENIRTRIDQMSARELREVPDVIAQHLDTCPDCRDHLDQAQRLGETLNAWEIPPADGNIAAAVMADIAQLEHNKTGPRFAWWPTAHGFLFRPLPVSVAAVLLMLIALAGSIGLNVSQQQRLSDAHRLLALVQQRPTPVPERIVQVTLPTSATVLPSASIMRAGNHEPVQTLFINPPYTPSAMVIILGVPPMISLEPERTAPSHYGNNPL